MPTGALCRLFLMLPVFSLSFAGCRGSDAEIERPERVVSKRQVLYDEATYARLALAWQKYYDAYPSEEAYGNWMYATRYGGTGDYERLLEQGVSRYPANPTLLYLKGLTKLGAQDRSEPRRLLERAAALDPSYHDPWYPLVTISMADRERERRDIALRHLLENGAIADEVMDFSYNMLACLEKNAILITNGDNDTYPGWILTWIVGYRPDVRIVNRSLLNTEWYPHLVIEEGVPAFVTKESLAGLLNAFVATMKEKGVKKPSAASFGDTLIPLILEAAEREGRPVYFACTMSGMQMEYLQPYTDRGTHLGLVTLVTPRVTPFASSLRRVADCWLSEFRTGGLDSWQLRHASDARAGRRLIINYAAALRALLPELDTAEIDVRLPLFRWYRTHVWKALPTDAGGEWNAMWCNRKNPPEIDEWCSKQGYAIR